MQSIMSDEQRCYDEKSRGRGFKSRPRHTIFLKDFSYGKAELRFLLVVEGFKSRCLLGSILIIPTRSQRRLLEELGQLIELSNWSKELGILRQTLSLYLRYLEESFIVKKLYNFSKSRRKTERRLKKYYPAVVSEDLLFRQDDISRSHAFEWIVIRLLNVDFFWRDPYKNEVDAVAVEGDKISAFEVKYGKIDTDGLITFMQHFKINSGTIISKEAQKSMKVDGKNVEVTPAYRFFCNGS